MVVIWAQGAYLGSLGISWQIMYTHQSAKIVIKRVFKGYSFLSSKNKKVDKLCMNFFSTPYTSVQQVLQPPFSRSTCPYRVASFFQRTSQPKGQDQQNSIRKYSRLPPKCLRINLKNMLSYFYRSIRAGFISPDIFLNFYSKRYISP